MTSLVHRRAASKAPTSGNAGKDVPVSWEERCARLQEENRQLKVQRNEQDQLIKDLNTKFRRLVRDYKAMTGVAPTIEAGSSTTPRSARSNSSLVSKLAAVEAQRDSAQKQLADMKRILKMRGGPLSTVLHQGDETLQYKQESIDEYLARHEREAIRSGSADRRRASSSHGSQRGSTPERSPSRTSRTSPSKPERGNEATLYNRIHELENEVSMLRRQRDDDARTIRNLESELSRARSGSSHLSTVAMSHYPHVTTGAAASDQSRELQNLREKVAADSAHIEALKRERDNLEFKLRMRPSSEDYQGYRSMDADPDTMIRLQREITEKSSQVTLLTSRFSHSQEQVQMLKNECDRLVDEIRSMHSQNAEIKRRMFDLEQEKNTLELKSDRVNELEVAYKLKADEVMNCEQKLLSLVDRLQSCSRETEMQVRRSCQDRFAELESMRDEADRLRRAKEHDNFTLKQDLSDSKAAIKNLKEELEQYKADVQKLRSENHELQEKAALMGSVPADLTDDVHKAMAMMTLKKKRDDELDMGELWKGIEWSDGWEASRMREAVSTATFDLQLADQRHQQLTEQLTEKTALLTGISKERDELLDENITLRRRITGIQTTLTKRMLQAAQDLKKESNASLTFTLTNIQCDPRITAAPDGSTFSPTLFFTLDGLEGYELAVSDHFYRTTSELAVLFVFGNLPVQPSTMDRIASATFVLQLHQSYGTECDVVAAGTIDGSSLLNGYDGSGIVSLSIDLVGVDGGAVGAVQGTATLSEEYVPFLLERKVGDPSTARLSYESLQANVLSLRSVAALRIHVYRATGLRSDGHIPQPYVFYTVTNVPAGLSSFIGDTVIHPSGSTVTANPTFDVNPREHQVIMDMNVVRFLHQAVVSFIVFDATSKDFETNLGVAAVPLERLLRSPTETIQTTETLHPQGTLEIGISWIMG